MEWRIDIQKILPECSFQASRSSGAGGQHVNKVSSKMEVRFDIPGSATLNDYQKMILQEKLATRLTKEGVLIVASEKTRSQFKNREDCIARLQEMLNAALEPEKERVPTRPSKASRRKRLERKKQISHKKETRRKPEL